MKHFKEHLKEFEHGTYLSVGDSGVWIQLDERELKIGIDLPCRYYHVDEDNFADAIDFLFRLLTKRIRIVQFVKGRSVFKRKIEVELSDSEYEQVGISMFWFFPYWKKTIVKTVVLEALLNENEIEAEINQIRTYA